MDKARPFEYVYRLPATTSAELMYREDVYDRQVLLNETWRSYAFRKGRFDELEDEHVKWITRTWDDDVKARSFQKSILEAANAEGERQIAVREQQLKSKQEISAAAVARVMAFQEFCSAKRTPCRHNLFVDFDLLQQEIFIGEQNIVSNEEELLRLFVLEGVEGLCSGIFIIQECHRIFSLMKLDVRLRHEEEERQRIAEEQQRAIEEEKRREEMRQKELEEAERIRKENLEQAKILERKKREEERRAKARLERERLKHYHNTTEVVPNDGKLRPLNAFEEVLPVSEGTSPLVENMQTRVSERERIVFSQPEGGSVTALIQSAMAILTAVGDTSYVMSIDKLLMKSTVVCEGGCRFKDVPLKDTCHLLGRSITEKTAISISSSKLHGTAVESWEQYYSLRVEVVENSRTDDRCFLFDESAVKEDETVMFFPLVLSGYKDAPYVLAVCRSGVNAFERNEVEEASKVVWELSKLVDLCLEIERRSQLSQQCVEWLTVVTGCENCYVSLREGDGDFMTYVAASDSHRFMVGKKHNLAEEDSGYGISFHACDAATRQGESMLFVIDDVNEKSCIPFENQKVKNFSEGEKTGSLLFATITGKKVNGECATLGVVFMDYVGTKRKFTHSDEEVLRLAVQILAGIFLNTTPLCKLGDPLKIEEDFQNLDPSSILFLKCLWRHALDDLGRITSGELLELAKYMHPPPIIPLVVQATLIVALGSNPRKIEKWTDAREKVTSNLLTKMSTFDPTDPKRRKKPFFRRAGKMLKGHVVKDVFERGSYPASCFFSWTFAAILLRKHADFLRKRNKQGETVIAFSDLFSSHPLEEIKDDDSDNEDDNETECEEEEP